MDSRTLIRAKAVQCFKEYLFKGYRVEDHVRDDETSYTALMKLVEAKAVTDAADVEAAKGLGAEDEDTVRNDQEQPDTLGPRKKVAKKRVATAL